MVRDPAMKDIESFFGAEKLEIAFSRRDFHWDDIVAAVAVLIALAILLFDSSFFNNDPFEHVLYECPQGEKPTQKPTQSNIGKVLEEQAKDFVIFYGSQSGRAYELAQRLSRDISRRFSKTALVADLSDYDCTSVADIPHEKLAFFILSTYGEDDPPDNASRFAEWIQGLPKKPLLQNLRFAMLGVGNSNYKFYNKFALQTCEKLQILGATPVMALELADDAKGETQDSFVLWKTKLFKAFVQNLGIIECPRPYSPLVNITPSKSEGDQMQMYQPVAHQASKTADSVVYPAIVSRIQNITPNAPRETLHVDIDISNEPKLKYAVGDHIAIWPENSASEMQQLKAALGLNEADMHQSMVIDRIDPDTPVPWPRPVTLDALFERHLDIAALVSRDLILDLKQFAKTPSSQEALDDLTRNYKHLCLTQRMTLASVLRFSNPEASAWASIPHSFILENLTPIKPRYYSIASTPAVSPRTISFTVSVKDIDLTSGERLLGLMSNSLLRMYESHDGPCSQGPRLWCNVRKSKFKPPVSPMQPMVMVANGSGIAPFVGFLRHRLRTFQLKGNIGKMLLVYGCQNEQMYLYKSEIEENQDVLGDRLQVVLAYSRKGGGYVQDQIRAHGLDVAELLCSGKANLYICGSTVMAREVRTRILELVQGRGSSEQQAQEFEAAQMRTKRWQFDVWG